MKPLSGRLGRCLGAASSRGSRCSVPVGTALGSQEPEHSRLREGSRLGWISHTAAGERGRSTGRPGSAALPGANCARAGHGAGRPVEADCARAGHGVGAAPGNSMLTATRHLSAAGHHSKALSRVYISRKELETLSAHVTDATIEAPQKGESSSHIKACACLPHYATLGSKGAQYGRREGGSYLPAPTLPRSHPGLAGLLGTLSPPPASPSFFLFNISQP